MGKETLREELGLERFYYDFTIPSRKGWRFVVLDGMDAGSGIIGDEQLAWLRSTLDQAIKKGEKVICFCHYPILPSSPGSMYSTVTEPVLEVIENSGCVVAWFAGHAHAGGYGFQKGIHHVTFKGMVETPTANAYAIVRVPGDRLEITGFGRESNRVLPLPAWRAVQQGEQ